MSDRKYSKPGFSGKKNSSSRSNDGKGRDDKPAFKRKFEKRDDGSVIKPRFKREEKEGDSEKRDERPSRFSGDKKPFKKRESDSERSFGKPKREGSFKKEGSSYGKDEKRSFKPRENDFKKKFGKREDESSSEKTHRRSKRSFESREESSDEKRSFERKDKREFHDSPYKKHKHESHHKESHPKKTKEDDGLTRLNKYLSNAGICSRREADELIKAGVVTVNGKVITEMGFKVKVDDTVNYDGAVLKHEKKVYLMLNKPKDYITTAADTHDRHTVMELIAGACKERVYPVGRLDRNTTGLLLFTNDGEMATKLMHPKFGIKKVYHVGLDKNLKPDDFKKLEEGFELEDGFIKPDVASYVGEGKREIGIEIHSGRNRIVRRIFEHLGYDVVKLDRVTYAGLTKKDLGRGKWRFLTPKEISFLKMIG